MKNKRDIFKKIGLIKLTKENHQILLDSNEGFSFQLSYNSKKDGAREREYKITNGNLYIHEAKTDGSYDESWIATDEEVHRFLSKYLWKLSLNDVII